MTRGFAPSEIAAPHSHQKDPTFTKQCGPWDPIPPKSSANTVFIGIAFNW